MSKFTYGKAIDERGRTAVLALITLSLVALFAGTIYGTYNWQQGKIDKLNTQNTQQQAELEASKKQISQPSYSYISNGGVRVNIFIPQSSAKVTTPLVVVGQVPGNWSFEASFPVQLKDEGGRVIAQSVAQVTGDWMTDQLVPFTAKLEFSSAESGEGTLVINKDNPSGLAQNDDSVVIPVRF